MATEEPLIITSKEEMRKWSRSMRAQGKTIGLVPAMGYLHKGHISLMNEAHQHAQLVVVSIYVNPGQFTTSEDLSSYPSDINGDLQKLKSVTGGVDVVFDPYDLYDYSNKTEKNCLQKRDDLNLKEVSCLEERGDGHETWIRVEKLEKGLCGKSRPLFFRGIATVVSKLFNIVEPDVALFGKKDYQQWRVIRKMALCISRSLLNAKHAAEEGQFNCRKFQHSVALAIEEAGGKIDYAEIVDKETLEAVEEIKAPVVICVAAWFGKARLIDNIEIDAYKSIV